MSSEEDDKDFLVIEDELEEGELSDHIPSRTRKEREPLPYRDDSLRKVKYCKHRTKSLLRKSCTILSKARKNNIVTHSSYPTRDRTVTYKRSEPEHEPKKKSNSREAKHFKPDVGHKSQDKNHKLQDKKDSVSRHEVHRAVKVQVSPSPPRVVRNVGKQVKKEIMPHISHQKNKLSAKNSNCGCANSDLNDDSYEALLEKYKYLRSALADLEEDDDIIELDRPVKSSSTEKRHNSISPNKNRKHTDRTTPNGIRDKSSEKDTAPVVDTSKLDEDLELNALRQQALVSRDRKWNKSLNNAPCLPNNVVPLFNSLLPPAGKRNPTYSAPLVRDNHDLVDMDLCESDANMIVCVPPPDAIVTDCPNEYSANMDPNSMERLFHFNHGRENSLSVEDRLLFEMRRSALQSKKIKMGENSVSSISELSSSVEVISVLKNTVVSSVVPEVNGCNFKLDPPNHSSNKTFYTSGVHFPKQPPLIIKVNQDSSDSESASDEMDVSDKLEKATLASLERLIDATKDEVSLSQGSVESSDVVEYLPGTQQEEYLRLKERLAQLETKQEAGNASFSAYSMLMKKLKAAKVELDKGNSVLRKAKDLSNEKKRAFIISQVRVRRLQEQLKAAIKIKDANKKLMFEANAKLHNVQSLVLKHTTLAKELSNKCTKLGKQIFGEDFSCDDVLK